MNLHVSRQGCLSDTCGKQDSLALCEGQFDQHPENSSTPPAPAPHPVLLNPTGNQLTKGWAYTSGKGGSAAAPQVQKEHSRVMSEPF